MTPLSKSTRGRLTPSTKQAESLATRGMLTFGEVIEAVRELCRNLLRPLLRDIERLPPP